MIPHKYPGKLILFEGGDGSGKSTQAKLAYQRLLAQYPDAILTKEPYTRTPEGRPVHLGDEIYQVLKGEHARTSMADLSLEQFQRYFYFPNRIHHYLDVVIPALKEGKIVLSDRGLASVCYGARSVGVLYHLMAEQLAMFEALQLPWPNAIIIYDVPAEEAIARMKQSGKQLDAHERLDVLEAVAENYRVFARAWPNCHLISGAAPPTLVAEWTDLVLDEVMP